MKRKFLEDIGLSKEQVDNIMAENGKDIEAIKSERDNYKTQLDTAQTTLKSFEGVNVQDLQGKVTKLTADLAAKDAEYQKQIADRDFNDLLKTTAEGYKPRDLKAVMPFLDVEKLKASKRILKLLWRQSRKTMPICFRTYRYPKWFLILLDRAVKELRTQRQGQMKP